MAKISKRLVAILLAAVITVMTVAVVPVSAANWEDGWGATWIYRLVYEDSNLTVHSGNKSISKGEGFTIIGCENGNFKINYSTSSGEKEGWISPGQLTINTATAYTAKVTSLNGVTVYARNGTNSKVLGSISRGETICVLGQEGSYYYVEYNTTNQTYVRKRGWVYAKSVEIKSSSSPSDNSFYDLSISCNFNGASLYYAPGDYEPWTSVTSTQAVARASTTINNQEYWYIEFVSSDGVQMSGYVKV